ncbi:MAG: type II toxin-antitoxin system RelB/DinJ family antitoxin [Chloroflexi bacterium]|nr:type II toxin-antitoxin system RelB/DinJ family antitoxin [Chloroflexota bacterium]MDA0244383.1 type II toxin-antitoxin system RelB/DinJ family antitoxin [Chloroflexota bacterium]
MNSTVQARISPELKEEAEAIFASMGMTTAEAIRIFLQQTVNMGGLPFQPMAKIPPMMTQEPKRLVLKEQDGQTQRGNDFLLSIVGLAPLEDNLSQRDEEILAREMGQ